MKRLAPKEIARRRVIERLDLSKGKGVIVAHGKTFEIVYDDVLDLTHAVEMIMLRLTGKVLSAKFRPVIKDRKALVPDRVVGGDYSLGPSPAPVEAYVECPVTERILKAHYLRVEINGNT